MAPRVRFPLVLAALAAALACAPPALAALPNTPDPPGYSVAGGSAEVRAVFRLGNTIYIGGSFTTVNGQSRTNLAAINASDGSLASWAPTTDGEVYAISGSGSTIYAGGAFANSVSPGGTLTARNGAAAFDPTSGSLLAWDPHPDVANIQAVLAAGSRVYLGGSFSTMNNGAVATTNLAAVNATTGTADSSWKPNPDGLVDGLAIEPDGSFLYPAGFYFNIGGVARNGLAAVSPSTGAVDPNWNPSDPSNGGSINAIAMSPDGSTVYVTGDFFVNLPPGVSMGHADRWKAAGLERAGNGSIGNAIPFNPVPDIEGDALAVTSSSVYFGANGLSSFGWNGGTYPRTNVAALDPVTGQPQAWNPQPNNTVYALFASPDQSVYVGGSFTATAQPPSAAGFASFTPPPAATTAATFTGTPQPGQTLTCSNGTWSGGTPQRYSYALVRDGTSSTSPSTGGLNYNVTNSDVGHTLACKVTATNRIASASSTSSAMTITAPPVPTPQPQPQTQTLPPPVLFKRVNIVPTSGSVLVELPGTTSFVRIQDATSVPLGTIVDATRGVVQLVSARDATGKTQTGTFYGGIFKITQLPGDPPITQLILVGGSFKACGGQPTHGASAAAGRKSKRSIRHLWADATGSFRTKGRYASATVRGTRWLTDDRCDGTLVRVTKGVVTVRDLVRRKSLTVRARHKYLALATRKRK